MSGGVSSFGTQVRLHTRCSASLQASKLATWSQVTMAVVTSGGHSNGSCKLTHSCDGAGAVGRAARVPLFGGGTDVALVADHVVRGIVSLGRATWSLAVRRSRLVWKGSSSCSRS